MNLIIHNSTKLCYMESFPVEKPAAVTLQSGLCMHSIHLWGKPSTMCLLVPHCCSTQAPLQLTNSLLLRIMLTLASPLKQGVGSAINRLNDVVAMIAEVRSIADSLGSSADRRTKSEEKSVTL